MFQQQPSLGRQPQAAGVALEERRADVLLKLLEPFRQAGLGGVGGASGVAETAGLREADQQIEVAQASLRVQSMPVYLFLYGFI